MIIYSVFIIFLILSFLLFIIIVSSNIVAIFTADVPFVLTPKVQIKYILENLNLEQDSVLYDLGCGDASILIEAVKLMPNIKAVGIEIAFFPYILAKFKTRNYKQIEIRRENIYETNISNATHIFMYLFPKVVNELVDNIKKQCLPKTRIISCDYELNYYKPLKIIQLDSNHGSKICKKLFIYST